MLCWRNDTVKGKLKSTTNTTCPGLGSNQGPCSEMLATNHRATAQPQLWHYSLLAIWHAVRSFLQLQCVSAC